LILFRPALAGFGFRYSNVHAVLNCQNQEQNLWDGVLVGEMLNRIQHDSLF